MKKIMVLFIAISFFAGVMLVGCGPKEEAPAPSTEQATPAAPAAPEAPAPAPAPTTEPAPATPPAAAPGK